MVDLTEDKLNDIIVACKKHQVVALSIFGSAAKNSMRDGSDIDFLVEFSGDMDVLNYADNYFSLLHQLQEILEKEVDLVSSKSLKNPVLREEINRTKIDLYKV